MATPTCPKCNNIELTLHEEIRAIRAADGNMLSYSATYTRCIRCGEEFYTKAQSKAASRAATGAIRHHFGLLAPDEIVAIRRQYGVTQVELERVLNLGKKSVVRWEAGTVTQSRSADRLLRELRDSPSMFARLAEQAGVRPLHGLSSAQELQDGWNAVATHFVAVMYVKASTTRTPGDRRRFTRACQTENRYARVTTAKTRRLGLSVAVPNVGQHEQITLKRAELV